MLLDVNSVCKMCSACDGPALCQWYCTCIINQETNLKGPNIMKYSDYILILFKSHLKLLYFVFLKKNQLNNEWVGMVNGFVSRPL